MPFAQAYALVEIYQEDGEAAMNDALKYDDGKPDLSLLPPPALRAVARVLMHGVEKYGRDNWKGGMKWSRLYASSMRHILEHMEGEREDPETGESPLAHAICGLMFLLIYELEGLGEDDLNGNTDSDDSPPIHGKVWLAGLIKFESDDPGYVKILMRSDEASDNWRCVTTVGTQNGYLAESHKVDPLAKLIKWHWDEANRGPVQDDRFRALAEWVLEQAIDHGATRSHGRITI